MIAGFLTAGIAAAALAGVALASGSAAAASYNSGWHRFDPKNPPGFNEYYWSDSLPPYQANEYLGSVAPWQGYYTGEPAPGHEGAVPAPDGTYYGEYPY